MTTTRVERKTASGIEWVTKMTVVAGALPDAQQLEVHALAGHLVERAEGLVHEQQGRIEGEGPGDRHPLLHAARELPGVVVGEVGSSTRLEHLALPSPARSAFGAPDDLERQLDVALHGAPVEEHRRLEDHPVVAVEARLVGRLAVDRRPCPTWPRSGRRSSRSSVDLPQPDGTDRARRTRPGGSSRSMSLSASTRRSAGRARHALPPKILATPASSTTIVAVSGGSGAEWLGRLGHAVGSRPIGRAVADAAPSARPATTRRKQRMPRAAAMMIARTGSPGWSV